MNDESRVWVTKLKRKGKHAYALRWIDYATGKFRSRVVGTDRKLADREAVKLEDQLERGTFKDVRKIGWAEFVEDHVGKIEGACNRTEAKRTLDEFGTMVPVRTLSSVKYATIESYIAKLRKGGNSVATRNKKCRYLRAAFNRAIKRGYASTNPVTSDLFQTEEQRQIRIIDKTEEAKLLTAADELYGFRLRAFIQTALSTGARRGELLGLTWMNVTLDDGDASVLFTHTKGRKDRSVPVDDDVADVLLRLKAKTLQAGGPFVGLADNIGRMWRRIVEHAGTLNVSMHDLRRTFVTRLIQCGVPLPTVQRLAGHSNIKTTLAHYNRVDTTDMRKAIERLRKLG